MKFLSKIKAFLDLRKKVRKINKFIEKEGKEEKYSNQINQEQIRSSTNKDIEYYESNKDFISRYEKIYVYRNHNKPKIEDNSERQNIFDEVSKELENIKSKYENENFGF